LAPVAGFAAISTFIHVQPFCLYSAGALFPAEVQ